MVNKTPHKWRASQMGYDPASYCDHCRANNYQSYGTEFCEDYKEAVEIAWQKEHRIHAPTEAVWNKLRELLSKEEWNLLEFKFKYNREYRIIDRIN